MKVIIGGIPGVGKTTVLNVLIKSGILVENYGDVMLKEAVRMNYVKNRDDLRKLPIDIQKNIQKKASEYLSGLSSVVIDTHFSIQTPGVSFRFTTRCPSNSETRSIHFHRGRPSRSV